MYIVTFYKNCKIFLCEFMDYIQVIVNIQNGCEGLLFLSKQNLRYVYVVSVYTNVQFFNRDFLHYS